MVWRMIKLDDEAFVAGTASETAINLPSNGQELEEFLAGETPTLLWNDTVRSQPEPVRASLCPCSCTHLFVLIVV